MKKLYVLLFTLSSFTVTAQELAIEVLSIIDAGTLNIQYLHEDTVFLPDGNGVTYESSITIEGFDSTQSILAGTDIAALGMIMEHSYLGDLNMDIICPNGQILNLKSYPGGDGNYLGEPLDNNSSSIAPGVGYYYMFKDSATYLDLVSEANFFDTVVHYILPEGSYLWEGNSEDLIGCPINGDWTLNIEDNLPADNGYIFNWQLFFNPDILPPGVNSGQIIIDIIDGGSPEESMFTDWYVEWSNGQTGLVADHLAPGEYTAWLREIETNILLDSIHVLIDKTINILSVNNYNKDLMKMYPNPVEDALTIEWKSQDVSYVILGLNGQVLHRGTLYTGLNKINTSALISGMYILQTTSGKQAIAQRFIKQ